MTAADWPRDKWRPLPGGRDSLEACLLEAKEWLRFDEVSQTSLARSDVVDMLKELLAIIQERWPGHFTGMPGFRNHLAVMLQEERMASAEFVLVPVDRLQQVPGACYLDIIKGELVDFPRLAHYHKRPAGQLFRIERRQKRA